MPCTVPASAIEQWRKNAQHGINQLEAAADDELDFHRVYYANLDAVFAFLLERFERRG